MTDAEKREAAKVAAIAALEAGDTETARREYDEMMAIKEKMELLKTELLKTEPGNGWRYRVDKDGMYVEYHHGDVIMRADDRGWIVRVGLNTESGSCHSLESGMEAARACLVRRITASISPIGLSITPIGVSP